MNDPLTIVTRDVPDYALIVGNPARVVGWMCQCGVRLALRGTRGRCRACGKEYHKRTGKLSLRS